MPTALGSWLSDPFADTPGGGAPEKPGEALPSCLWILTIHTHSNHTPHSTRTRRWSCETTRKRAARPPPPRSLDAVMHGNLAAPASHSHRSKSAKIRSREKSSTRFRTAPRRCARNWFDLERSPYVGYKVFIF